MFISFYNWLLVTTIDYSSYVRAIRWNHSLSKTTSYHRAGCWRFFWLTCWPLRLFWNLCWPWPTPWPLCWPWPTPLLLCWWLFCLKFCRVSFNFSLLPLQHSPHRVSRGPWFPILNASPVHGYRLVDSNGCRQFLAVMPFVVAVRFADAS